MEFRALANEWKNIENYSHFGQQCANWWGVVILVTRQESLSSSIICKVQSSGILCNLSVPSIMSDTISWHRRASKKNILTFETKFPDIFLCLHYVCAVFVNESSTQEYLASYSLHKLMLHYFLFEFDLGMVMKDGQKAVHWCELFIRLDSITCYVTCGIWNRKYNIHACIAFQ